MKREYIIPMTEMVAADCLTALLAVSGDPFGGVANAAELPEMDDMENQLDRLLDNYLLQE